MWISTKEQMINIENLVEISKFTDSKEAMYYVQATDVQGNLYVLYKSINQKNRDMHFSKIKDGIRNGIKVLIT